MDETDVKRVLAPYCPPLGQSQIEVIVSEIVELSKKEREVSKSVAKVASRRQKNRRMSRSRE